MGRRRRPVLATLAGIILSVGLAACSSSGSSEASKSASQIFTDSQHAMTALSSVRVTGHMSSNGQDMAINLILTKTTSGGTFTTPKGSFELISTGSTVYMKANESFWVDQAGVPASVAQQMADKWVTGLPASDTKSLTDTLNLQKVINQVFSPETLTKGATTTIAGQSAIPLISAKTGIGYVAADGPAYLLKITSPNNGAEGEITFSQFNSATAPTVPTNVVNLNSLGG